MDEIFSVNNNELDDLFSTSATAPPTSTTSPLLDLAISVSSPTLGLLALTTLLVLSTTSIVTNINPRLTTTTTSTKPILKSAPTKSAPIKPARIATRNSTGAASTISTPLNTPTKKSNTDEFICPNYDKTKF